MKNKALKRIFIALVAIVAAVLIVVGGFSVVESIVLLPFYANANVYQETPGLFTGFTHQGYTLVEEAQVRLACGYMSNGKASRIYIMPENGDAYSFVELKYDTNRDYLEHTGGIAVYGNTVFVTGTTGLDIFSLEDVLDGDGKAILIDQFDTVVDPAYATVKDDKLYIGSFFREGNYETPLAHRIETPAGDNNTAIMEVYELNKDTGLPTSSTPCEIYSTPGLVQGMAFTDDNKIIFSTSYGLAASHLLVYDIDKFTSDGKTLDVNGTSITITYIDSSALVDDIKAPPMSEEIIYKDGTVYILNESASNKYVFGMFTSGTRIYGYKMK